MKIVLCFTVTAQDAIDGARTPSCDHASGDTFGYGTTTVTCTATDTNGTESSGSFTVTVVDTTAPDVPTFVDGPAADSSSVFGTVAAAPTCTSADSGTGVASCVVTGYSTAVGTHTLTATATDNAGNTSTTNRAYTVAPWTFQGFYSPVDMNGVVNTVKNGSTVPLKFNLFAGETKITDTSAVTFSARKLNCTTAVAEDSIEVVSTGGTTLRYDATGGQFIQNWKTPTGAGTCYSVTVTSTDGSSITALFKLK